MTTTVRLVAIMLRLLDESHQHSIIEREQRRTLRELLHAYELFVRKYWAMWLLDIVAKLLGRSPLTTKKVDAGRGAFFRVEF